MLLSDVNRLLAAGFTADEIRSMEPGEPEAIETAAPADDRELPPETTGADTIAALTAAVQSLQKTVAEIQRANIIGTPAPEDKKPSADDAIKNFLSKL